MRYFAQTFILLFSFIALPACAEEESNSMPGANADGIPYAVDQSLSWVERRDKHMAACLDARSEKFCAEPLKYNYQAGDEFQDCIWCPVMVVIPPGTFLMGTPESEPFRDPFKRDANQRPQVEVTINYMIGVGKFEITNNEFLKCVNSGACNKSTFVDGVSDARLREKDTKEWAPNSEPVMMVDWIHVHEYLEWASSNTQRKYRLPTESEWEYAARAGTTTLYAFGDTLDKSQANIKATSFNAAEKIEIMDVGSFLPNNFGLHDMHGSVAEWAQDCYKNSLVGHPVDGSAWMQDNCNESARRGGSRNTSAIHNLSANRMPFGISNRDKADFIGFRVFRGLN